MDTRQVIFTPAKPGASDYPQDLIDLLESIGCATYPWPREGGGTQIDIIWDDDSLRKRRARGAGRKELLCGIAYPDLTALIDSDGPQAACDRLGVSRATLYRRLARARQLIADGMSPDDVWV